MSGARSGDSELIRIWRSRTGKNFPLNQEDLDRQMFRGSVGLSSFALDCQLCLEFSVCVE